MTSQPNIQYDNGESKIFRQLKWFLIDKTGYTPCCLAHGKWREFKQLKPVASTIDGGTRVGRGEMHTQPDHLLLNEFLS